MTEQQKQELLRSMEKIFPQIRKDPFNQMIEGNVQSESEVADFLKWQFSK